jgi:hypothetical protein
MAILEALPGWTWDPKQANWDLGVDRLQAFVAREGHARVPRGHKELGFPLGNWVTTRRSENRRGTLAPDRVELLEAMPGWVWDHAQHAWKEAMDHMRAFVGHTGHAAVPFAHREGAFRLGSWVNNRRTEYKQGRLPPDRVAELETLPGWVWKAR